MKGPAVCLDTLFPELEAHEKLVHVARAGIPLVEFWGWRDKRVNEFQRVASDLGVAVSNFSAHRCGSPISIAEHDLVLKEIEESIEIAQTLACTTLMVLSNELGEGGRVLNSWPDLSDHDKQASIVELLSRAVELLPDNLTLVIEPLNTKIDHPGNHLCSMQQAIDIVRRVGDPRVLVLADLYHLGVMGETLERIVNDASSSLGYIHIADIPGRGEPGTGSVEWAKILRTLESSGYGGVVGFEYFPSGDCDRSLAAVKSLWDSLSSEGLPGQKDD